MRVGIFALIICSLALYTNSQFIQTKVVIPELTNSDNDWQQCLLNDLVPLIKDLESCIQNKDASKLPQIVMDLYKAWNDCKKLVQSVVLNKVSALPKECTDLMKDVVQALMEEAH